VPEFADPFSGGVPDRILTTGELIRAIRLDIAAEHEAIHLYMAHADVVEDPLAKAVLIDIANEEIEHVGEFERLLEILSPDETQFRRNGVGEVDDMMARVAAAAPGGESPPAAGAAAPDAPAGETPLSRTIGSLRSQRPQD
jgi:uncharacterized protein